MTSQARPSTLHEDHTQRQVRKVRGNGWLARRRWQKIVNAAVDKDPIATEVLERIAEDSGHPRHQEVRDLLVTRWVTGHDEHWRSLVLDCRAVASTGFARLASASLNGTPHEAEEEISAPALTQLLYMADPIASEHIEAYVREAKPELINRLWSETVDAVSVLHLPIDHPLFAYLLSCPAPTRRTHQDSLCDQLLSEEASRVTTICSAISRWHFTGGSDDTALLASRLIVEPKNEWPKPEDVSADHLMRLVNSPDSTMASKARTFLQIHSPSELTETLCDRALDDDSIRALCIELRLAPADLARRAKFYLFTNQPTEYRQIDADGSLLALIYDASTPEDRGQLQQAMLTMRDVNLVRAVVGADRRTRALSLTDKELEFLATQLHSRQAWDDLWQLSLELPLTTTMRLILQIPQHSWRPSNPDDAALFDAMRHTPVIAVSTGRDSLRESLPPAAQVARIRFHGRVNDVSFAPDEASLAVGGSARVAATVDLTTGRLNEVYRSFESSVGRVLHLANGVVIAGERTTSPLKFCHVVSCSRGSTEVLVRADASITALAAFQDRGFFAASRDANVHLINSLTGKVTKRSMLAMRRASLDWPRSIAVSPDGSTVAVISRAAFLTDPTFSTIRARTDMGGFAERTLLTEAGYLIMSQLGTRAVWLRQEGDKIVEKNQLYLSGVTGMGYLPQRGQIVFVDQSGILHFTSEHGARVLDKVPSTIDTYAHKATSMTVSPRGDLAAVGFAPREYSQSQLAGGFVDLYDLRIGQLPSLLDQPLASTTPAHLGALASVQQLNLPPDARLVLGLLQKALEHRFRYDISITDIAALTGGEYDIHLERT